MNPRIVYTITDEAPMLATYSFLPVVRAFTRAAGIDIDAADISLAARILAAFPDVLDESRRRPDILKVLGELVLNPDANVIKLPNISASVPQLKAAIRELQQKGFALPDYPEDPADDVQKGIKARYDKVKGSAVNPVIREGNSDRRAAAAVKAYAKNHPHSMGAWSADSKSHVAAMTEGDFYGSERSLTLGGPSRARIEFVSESGEIEVLKGELSLEAGEILDSAVMDRQKLEIFFEKEIADAKERDVLFSLHMKATMMKVSDPVIFGSCVSVFYKAVFEAFGEELASAGVDPANGFGDVVSKIEALPAEVKSRINDAIHAVYNQQPALAMVNSDKGITNLHVPSDVIIDASMPAAIRNSGQMWGPDGKQKDTKFVIPDRCYAGVYAAAIEYCKEHGAFDPATMGSVSNVGLMARQAEEYGSHDKTFIMKDRGTVRIIDEGGLVLLEQKVSPRDIFRACQVKDAPVKDWIGLAVKRARATGVPAVFWLDDRRAHDRELIKKVELYLPEFDTHGLEILIMTPIEATTYSLERSRKGLDTISVTGNVLRDYLTDLFPILELGTSAKMLSIVPLMNGGGLFETGAGGSAPKHVQQFLQEGHLRWDSLGEYLALAVSLEHLSEKYGNTKALVLAKALDRGTGRYLEDNRSPSRKVGELDNRGSHFYLTLYWASELAAQTDDRELQQLFKPVASALAAQEMEIMKELNAAQGSAVDIGGYYCPSGERVSEAMRPSSIFNRIIDSLVL
ncbi:MAG: NADP-dependent isocitrate dehydrogenase [Spirochaetales bacterium]|nr:NADP-dependent isocitrate dehydrogenase [Spirochaetales bacterium]